MFSSPGARSEQKCCSDPRGTLALTRSSGPNACPRRAQGRALAFVTYIFKNRDETLLTFLLDCTGQTPYEPTELTVSVP